ncbi:MAG: phosphoribosylformylglycinamidine cyclo-ligase [Dehalococcoidia bacterium]|nr:phosphoribosylformylglycinamidine cyclo-ligase [Dehalococcoidia bacterium]
MEEKQRAGLTYAAAGVDDDAAAEALEGLLRQLRATLDLPRGAGAPLSGGGFFASVLHLTDALKLAVSTDGVGSKAAVAQAAHRYEPIGWDCVAVNVNDVLCVGARPVALLDYISLQEPRADLLEALGKGMAEAAERAGVAIVGGELSQHPDTLTGPRPGYAFDIAGTALGVIEGREPIDGSAVRPGDVIIGMSSDGIHANGLTLARRVLLPGGKGVDRPLPQCGGTVGDELLRPTHVYVPEVLALLDAGVPVHGLAHISGGGLLNLARLNAEAGYRVEALPPAPPVFEVIREEGDVEVTEMFRVFNMGVGFCAVAPREAADDALAALRSAGGEAQVIGVVVDGPRRVEVEPYHLVGEGGRFAERRRR